METIQRKAVALKLRRRTPVIVMRWWDAPANKRNTFVNRLIYNRHTGINFTCEREAMHANTKVAAGGLRIDNPVVLQQSELLGDDSPFKMMRHTLASLTEPNRADMFGRVKTNHGHLRLSIATIFYCNQQDIGSVTSLLEEYAQFPADVLDRVQFVIVDDGSPIEYTIPPANLNLTWIKVDQDFRWNQSGARNLAVLYSRSDNLVVSDLDHSFPAETIRWLIARNVGHRRFYKFHRRRADGTIIKGHPNTFYLSRGRFLQLFGTDEEFAGGQGADDYRFVKHLKNHGTVLSYLPEKFPSNIRTLDRKRQDHSLSRDLSINTPVDARKRMEVEYYGRDYGHSRQGFNFTWTVKADRVRQMTFIPSIDRWWKRGWLLRSLSSLIGGG